MYQISNNNRLSELLSKEVLNYLFPGVAPEKMPTIILPQESKAKDSYTKYGHDEDSGVRFSVRGNDLADEYTEESVPQLFGGDFEDEVASAPRRRRKKLPKPPKPEKSKTGFWTVFKEASFGKKIDSLFDEMEHGDIGADATHEASRDTAHEASQKATHEAKAKIAEQAEKAAKQAEIAAEQAEEARTNAILQRIRQIQTEFGISVEELGRMLEYEVHPSRIAITKAYKIILIDFDNREVRMDPLSKAVFLLFLRHPEGIAYKDMLDYRSELLELYGAISRSSDPEAIEQSVDRLCNTVENNSINEKVSKVKRAFINAVDERIAKYYIIDGPAGEARRISLPRNLVNWL